MRAWRASQPPPEVPLSAAVPVEEAAGSLSVRPKARIGGNLARPTRTKVLRERQRVSSLPTILREREEQQLLQQQSGSFREPSHPQEQRGGESFFSEAGCGNGGGSSGGSGLSRPQPSFERRLQQEQEEEVEDDDEDEEEEGDEGRSGISGREWPRSGIGGGCVDERGGAGYQPHRQQQARRASSASLAPLAVVEAPYYATPRQQPVPRRESCALS